jgi:hypothetical protein
MKTRFQIAAALLLCLAALTLGGCRRSIVRAAPPSVATPPPAGPAPQPAASSPAPIAAPELPLPVPELVLFPVPEPEPPRTRPASVAAEPEPVRARTEVPPPQISAILSRTDQERLTRLTTDSIRVAERNLQLAGGRQLNAAQNDLIEKVRGFLSQAHEAIRANDWVRSQNLAEKAQVLSADLIRSF